MSVELKYGVTGMTCGHCVHAVTEEVSALTGVSEVKIDLINGGQSTMTLTTENGIDFDQVKEAVAEAGDYVAVPL
ncbi:heavy-metal-associated domain protein [mine drainage metagenome]|uniref:Heavy-metal-associated domain protein n=1 Tax=mine drainage metagenome TaxID=410659 RepID=A0A1J5PYH5_9ZZZZ